MTNGDAWEQWKARIRRTLPGAGEEEIERRAKIAQDARGGRAPGFGRRGMQERPRGGGGLPDFGGLSDDVLKLWRQMISGIQTYRKAWGEVQEFATRGERGPVDWRQWAQQAGRVARRGAQRGLEYLRSPVNEWWR